MSDTHDSELWYETNPSLGTVLTERAIRSELGDDRLDDNIQRLGLWLSYNQKSAITREEWRRALVEKAPKLPKEPSVFFGVKFSRSTGNVALAAAVKLDDGKIFVEAVDIRPVREGNSWLIPYLLIPHANKTVIDGANGQTILSTEMADAGCKCKVILPKVQEVIDANALFEANLFGGQICYSDQPSLEQAAANCEHRSIGSAGGFGYASILEGADIALVEAVSLAHWACATQKQKKKQRVFY